MPGDDRADLGASLPRTGKPAAITRDGDRVVASYATAEEAWHALASLADSGFPVASARIIARDFELVTIGAGRPSVVRDVLMDGVVGALAGATFGLLFAVVASLGAGTFGVGLKLGGSGWAVSPAS